MRKYSIVWARAKLLGGMIATGPRRSTKLSGLKFFGSTTALSTLVKILNSSADPGVVAVGGQAVGDHPVALLRLGERLDHGVVPGHARIQRSDITGMGALRQVPAV